ncbi:FAD-dependent monooxygenase [Streptomyces griseus]|uniref:FAD-dependent monooxygenase n=1 Tax=Streptomyces griseus TaxID=1911 RepID=UPI00373AF486
MGAGPTGLSVAAELRRHGVRHRLVDRPPTRMPYAPRRVTPRPGMPRACRGKGDGVGDGVRVARSTGRYGMAGGP